MVAYAYAAMYRREVEKLALMDAFLPGVGGWEAVYNNPGIWHFRFYGAHAGGARQGPRTHLLRALLERFRGRQDAIHSGSGTARIHEVPIHGRAGWRRGFAYFESFPKTAADFAELAKTRLSIPLLSIGGEKSLGEALGGQAKLVASDVTVVVLKNAGHWILEESRTRRSQR